VESDVLILFWDTSDTISQKFRALVLFKGSISVAYGDLNVDDMKVIVVAAGLGDGPREKVFDGERGNVIAILFAYDSRFSGGVNVATGDVNGDGALDIITG
jgi:hypothetical protein